MKNLLTMGTVVPPPFISTATATASESNQTMKACLHINGYTVEQFDTFDWSKSPHTAQCIQGGEQSTTTCRNARLLKTQSKI